MKSTPKCSECRFWRRLDKGNLYPDEKDLITDEDDVPLAGECRRFPPTRDTVLFGELSHRRMKATGYTTSDHVNVDAWQASVLPVTDEDDWCGEWQI